MTAHSIRAVLFDVDDTLLPTTEFAARARRAAVEAMVAAGLDQRPEDLLHELEEVVAEFTSNYDRHFDVLLRRVPAGSFAGVNRALIVAAGVVAYHRTKHDELAAYPDARELLARLAGTDLIRGVITAGLELKQAEKLVRLGVVPHLSPQAVFISDQIGISKPNPKLYQKALRALELAPGEAMYVGDNPANDIEPAHGLGMVTVRLRRGRHAGRPCAVRPDYEIDDFEQLRAILVEQFGVELGASTLAATT